MSLMSAPKSKEMSNDLAILRAKVMAATSVGATQLATASAEFKAALMSIGLDS